MKTKIKIIDMCYIALFTVIIAICSWISIPAQVPFTLQTFAIFCTLFILGGFKGTVSVFVYILLGAIGVPVFAGFSGGIGVLFGSTGGYILGFLLIALIYWLFSKLFKNKTLGTVLSMIIGTLLCYLFGTIWFMIIYTSKTGPVGFATALGWCVIPYIIPDTIKMILALFISKKIKKYAKI